MNERQRNIRTEMLRRGITGAEIARALGVSRQQVSRVIAGEGTSARVVKALVDAGIPEKLLKR